jgi:PAS domain S-box-containing protein
MPGNLAQDRTLLEKADEDLAHRTLVGVWGYSYLTLVLVFATDYRKDHPHITSAIVVVTLFLCAARLLIIRSKNRLYPSHPRAWRGLLYASVLLVGGCWGILAALTIALYSWNTWTAMVVVYCVVGTCSTSMTVLTPSRSLLFWNQAALLGPAIAIALYVGTGHMRVMGALTAVYLGFVMVHGKSLSGKYWEALRDRELLRVADEAKNQVLETLRESEERFRRVFEEGPLGVALVGKGNRFVKVNAALCQLVGYSEAELLGMSITDISHPDDVQASIDLADKIRKLEKTFYQMDKRYVRKSGEIIWVKLTVSTIHDQNGKPLYGLGMIEDITEVKRMQEEAVARQKLESLGVLANGIAHDFNNLLGGILAEAELVMADLPVGSPAVDEIQRIKQSAIRGAEIVRQIMIYTGQDQNGLTETVDVSLLVKEMMELLKVSISKHAFLRADPRDNLPPVRGSAAQIRQVVMNLVINASEAIGEKEGVIFVTTSEVSRGNYVSLEVSDTGCGITEEAQAKIFDPFYTTKFPGRGLGLAVVQGIIRAHGGAISVVSVPDQGTTFRVLMPCAAAMPQQTPPAIKHDVSDEAGANPSRVRTILVVEDEKTLRRAVSKLLRKRGFAVIEAGDGSTATDLMRSHTGDIDAVLLDVTLPGMPSREVFEEAQRSHPDSKVIVTSAYSKETVDALFPGLAVEHFIRKPFQIGDIARLLEEILPVRPKRGPTP